MLLFLGCKFIFYKKIVVPNDVVRCKYFSCFIASNPLSRLITTCAKWIYTYITDFEDFIPVCVCLKSENTGDYVFNMKLIWVIIVN